MLPESDDTRFLTRSLICQTLSWAALVCLVILDLRALSDLSATLLLPPLVLLAQRCGGSLFRNSLFVGAALATVSPGLITLASGEQSSGFVSIWGDRLIVLATLLLIYRQARKSLSAQVHTQELLATDRHQKTMLDTLSKHLPLQMWSADADGNLIHASEHLVEFTGASEQEILADWPSFLHPEDRERVVHEWKTAVQKGDYFVAEFRLHRHDGKYLWHKTQASPVFDPGNHRPYSWLGSAYNIDDLVRLRLRADQLAARLRQTIDSITDAFLTLDSDFRITYINQKATDIFASHSGSLLGKSIWEIGVEHPGNSLAGKLRECMTNRQESHFEARYPAGGQWFDVRIYPSDRGLTIYLLDITESKREKEQLSLLNNAVARLNDIILITEASPLDKPGPRIVFVNDAFERKTGYRRDEVLGKSPRILQGSGTQRSELDRIRAALESNVPIRSQLLNYTKTGDELWLEIEIVPVANEQGQNTHLIAVERDITEQRKLEHQLIVAQRMESIGQLTGGVAHDFNNLLGVIIANADLLQGELEKHEAWQLSGMVDLIIRAAERGAALTQNMLAFARRQPLHPQNIDLGSLLADITPILRSSAGERNKLHLNVSKDVWPVEIDVAQMENSLINLTLNARDAMPAGGTITITLANCIVSEDDAAPNPGLAAGEYVLLEFSDTGEGMSKETVARVFEPFFTTKEKLGGTGLGLSTIYGFIKQSDGYIHVSSERGKGTVFRLYLRRAQSSLSDTPASHSLETQADEPHPYNQTILVVEDNRDMQRVNAMTLEAAHFRVVMTSDAMEAIRILGRRSDIDLVLSDIVMPGNLSGIDLAEHIRIEYPDLPVILTSGYSELGHLSGDERWKQFEFLKKPYRPRDLLSAILKTLGEGDGRKRTT